MNYMVLAQNCISCLSVSIQQPGSSLVSQIPVCGVLMSCTEVYWALINLVLPF